MAEEEINGVGAQSNKNCGQRLDRESGRVGAWFWLQETADKALEEHLMDVACCIMDNIRLGHMPSVNLLVGLATKVSKGKDIPAEEYQSLAEVLKKAYQEQMEEQEAEKQAVLA